MFFEIGYRDLVLERKRSIKINEVRDFGKTGCYCPDFAG